ncbi:MAG: hypothetical protein WBP55_06415 [Solirubrobacterales bacterium]
MKAPGLASIVAAAILAVSVLVPTVSAAPQGPWVQPAVDLSGTGEDAYAPQITTAPDGTAIAVWQRFNGSNMIIQAATRAPGGGFGPAVDLSTSGQDANTPQITTAPDGTATAVWRRYSGSFEIIQAATRPPGGSFGIPVDISAPGHDAYSPQIVASPDGTFSAVWRRSNGSNSIIQASTRPPGGAFGLPSDLSAPGQSATTPQVASSLDGRITAVWSRFDGSIYIIQASTRPPGEPFGGTVELSTGSDASSPQITTSTDGSATVVWIQSVSPYLIIQAATRPSGGSFFSSPVSLSNTGHSALSAQITTAPDGTATAVWRRYNGSDEIIQAATRPPGGSFGPPVDLSATGQDADAPQVAAVPDGSATAVWLRSNGSNNIIQATSTAPPFYILSVTSAGTGSGSVTSSPKGLDCGADCEEAYSSFTKVTMTAAASPGSTFDGWKGPCESELTDTCELAMLEDTNVTATFEASPASVNANLKIKKVKPKKPKVKRGKKVKFKVTAKNTGDATAEDTSLCLKLSKGVKKRLKPKGKACQKLGALAQGQTKTVAFKLVAANKAKRGKKYKVAFKLAANGIQTVGSAVMVKIK